MADSEEAPAQGCAGLTTTVSLSWKQNLGNYESCDIFLSLSGVTKDTTEEEMEEMMTQGGVATKVIRKHLVERGRALHDKLRGESR